MLESGPYRCKDAGVDCASKVNWVNPGTEANQLTYELVQVEGCGTSLLTSDAEVIEADHLLAEPPNEKDLGDDTMFLSKECTEKCLAMEDFPGAVDYYGQEVDCGLVGAGVPQVGKQESKYEFVDRMLQGVDEERNLHLTYNLPSLCPDYLFGSGCAENFQLNYVSHESEKSGSECQTHSIRRSSNVGEISKFSKAIGPLAESTSDHNTLFLDNMNVHELHDAFRSTFGRDTSVKDKQWLKRHILFGLQNLGEFDNVSNPAKNELSSSENEDSMILIPGSDLCERACSFFTDVPDRKQLMAGRDIRKDGENSQVTTTSQVASIGLGILNSRETESGLITSKRLRKPTRRYIEESSEMKSRDKIFHVKTDRQFHQEFSAVNGIQVARGLHVRRGRPKKNSSFMGMDSKVHMLRTISSRTTFASQHFEPESQDDISDDYAAETRNDKKIRRKHHKQWTLSEVVKLVDGVTQYGVGRWTEIKRLLFTTSAYRTSVDLKDKWRNLLRASGALLHKRNQVDTQKKHASFSIPQSVLRRVRELAIIHPYPRERKTRLPLAATTSVAACSSDTSIRRSGRTIQKQSFA